MHFVPTCMKMMSEVFTLPAFSDLLNIEPNHTRAHLFLLNTHYNAGTLSVFSFLIGIRSTCCVSMHWPNFRIPAGGRLFAWRIIRYSSCQIPCLSQQTGGHRLHRVSHIANPSGYMPQNVIHFDTAPQILNNCSFPPLVFLFQSTLPSPKLSKISADEIFCRGNQ